MDTVENRARAQCICQRSPEMQMQWDVCLEREPAPGTGALAGLRHAGQAGKTGRAPILQP